MAAPVEVQLSYGEGLIEEKDGPANEDFEAQLDRLEKADSVVQIGFLELRQRVIEPQDSSK